MGALGIEQIGVEVLRRVALLWVGEQAIGGIYALTVHEGIVIVEEGIVGS